MYRILLLLIGILFFSKDVKPQQNQDLQLFAYNIGFNGLTAGIGSMINKSKTTKLHTAFIQGFWKGSIGGLFIYAGKKTTYFINKERNYLYGWPAKLIHSVGLSVTENAALAKPAFANYHINLGLTRLDFNLVKKSKIQARILPVSLITILFGFKEGRRFDFDKTIRTGEIIFTHPTNTLLQNRLLGDFTEAYSLGGCLVFAKDVREPFQLFSHELVHQFQYRENMIISTWLPKQNKRASTEKPKKSLIKYFYPEVPAFWLFYVADGIQPPPNYFKNFYEFEAERFSTNKYVPR